jgi:hypothetical protein
MAANVNTVFPLTPIVGIATFTSQAAITSRANITGVTGLVQLTATSTNGTRIDKIKVSSKETTVAGILSIWIYNGTTSFLFDELIVGAVTGSTTLPGYTIEKDYQNLVLPPTYQLYVSPTVDQDLNIIAFGGQY